MDRGRSSKKDVFILAHENFILKFDILTTF